MKTRYILRSPAGDVAGEGSGPDNVGTSLMEGWGNGDGLGAGAPSAPAVGSTPPPAPRQVTPPIRPQQNVISDNTPANQVQPNPYQQNVQPDPNAAQIQNAAPAGLSEADLTRIATTAAMAARGAVQPQSGQQQQQVTQPAAMTDEQFAARYRTPQVNAQVMQAIHDPDPAKGAAALQQVLKQTYTSALLMANDLHQAELAKVRGEFQPHIETFQQQQRVQAEQRLETEFYTTNPDLVNERDLVKEVTDALQAKVARGEIRFSTKEQAFKAAADSVKKLLARMGGTSSSAGQQTPPNQEQPTASVPTQRRMSSATAQSRGGTGQQSASNNPMDRVMDSWNS